MAQDDIDVVNAAVRVSSENELAELNTSTLSFDTADSLDGIKFQTLDGAHRKEMFEVAGYTFLLPCLFT